MRNDTSGGYWSIQRANAAVRPTEKSGVKRADALREIRQAIRDAFPAASEVTACADESEFLVKFAAGHKHVSVRFSDEALRAYARCEEVFRQQALKTLRLVCNFAFAREYTPDHDTAVPFVIDAGAALANTSS
jgi:hypothetical protein